MTELPENTLTEEQSVSEYPLSNDLPADSEQIVSEQANSPVSSDNSKFYQNGENLYLSESEEEFEPSKTKKRKKTENERSSDETITARNLLSPQPFLPNVSSIDPNYFLRAIFDCYFSSNKIRKFISEINPTDGPYIYQPMKKLIDLQQNQEKFKNIEERESLWCEMFLFLLGHKVINRPQQLTHPKDERSLSEKYPVCEFLGRFGSQLQNMEQRSISLNKQLTSDSPATKNPLVNATGKLTELCNACQTYRTFSHTPCFFFPISVTETSGGISEQLQDKMQPTQKGEFSERKCECACEQKSERSIKIEIEDLNDLLMIHPIIQSSNKYSYRDFFKDVLEIPEKGDNQKIRTYKLIAFILEAEEGYVSIVRVNNNNENDNESERWHMSVSAGVFDVTGKVESFLNKYVRLAVYERV